MRTTLRRLAIFLALGVLLAPNLRAQEEPKRTKEPKPITALKVQVVLSEFEGEKKISSLPYTIFVNADDRMGRPSSSVRMGLRVPLTVQGKDNQIQFQYMDVGTNIDCSADTTDDGRFRLGLTVERSSLYTTSPERKSLDWNPGDPPLSTSPVIRQFKVSFSPLVRDGQTAQSTVATDPVSGRVLKVDVTLNVLK